MTTRNARRAAPLLAFAATLALVGCATDDAVGRVPPDAGATVSVAPSPVDDGFERQSNYEMFTEALTSMKRLKSLHYQGVIVDGDETAEVDLTVDDAGECTGSVGVGGGTAQIIAVDGTQYLKGDLKFWTNSVGPVRGPRVHALIGDRWAQVPATSERFQSFCDLDEFLKQLESVGALVRRGHIDQIAGREAIAIFGREDGSITRLWIATEDPHYLLKIEVEGKESGDLSFSGFDVPVDAKAPDSDEFVDLSSLQA